MLATSVLALLALGLPQAPAAKDAAAKDAAAKDATDAICKQFGGYDQNGDGVVELAHVMQLHAAGVHGPRVVVLVESRLLADQAGRDELEGRLQRFVTDLGEDGYRATAVQVQLGASSAHQDGRYVLAMRELLRAFAGDAERAGTHLAGALLVGHFPDAFVVRTCNWRKHGDVRFRKGTPQEARYRNWYLRRVPEDVAHRADIVLSDLTGRWEDVYVQPKTRLQTTVAMFKGKIPARGGPVVDLEHGAVVYEDFFHVSDGKLEVREVLGKGGEVVGREVFADDRAGDHECSEDDRQRANVLAVPDIVVSRIDPRGIALRVRPDIVGADGQGLLDATGRPQAVTFAERKQVPRWHSVWELDPELERRLLAEYLDRNHAYRTGSAKTAWRATSVAHGLPSGFREMTKAAKDWLPRDRRLSDITRKANLSRVVEWLNYPAVLRTVRAHSDAWGSVFERQDVKALASLLRGPAWSWSPQGSRLVPSLHAACSGGKLDWFLLHTLWKNGAVSSEPCFYHHTGCHGISPGGAKTHAYDHPVYGVRQGAEALLFFGSGLALVGRAKVFYDEPRGFASALGEGQTFGAAWARYFELESRAESWSRVGGDIGRKRAYFWSVLGDWTLRLQRNG